MSGVLDVRSQSPLGSPRPPCFSQWRALRFQRTVGMVMPIVGLLVKNSTEEALPPQTVCADPGQQYIRHQSNLSTSAYLGYCMGNWSTTHGSVNRALLGGEDAV
ncbi:hypothetical protein FKP32DRAFT_1587296 [Trametes sanguinea]|nr:hypothetical protein FKP32DRAFT_1587296 [Trametes sanguinea]